MQEEEGEYILMDIGGTLSKLCIVTRNNFAGPVQEKLTIKLGKSTIYFTFFKFIQECWEYLNTHFHAQDSFRKIIITGGGAYKYESELKQIAQEKKKNIQIVQQFQSLVSGLSFFKAHLEIEEFVFSSFSHDTKQTCRTKTSFQSLLGNPILVANIGSGVSFLLVTTNEEGQLSAERVGGTSLGGGFFLGLANLLVGQNNFHKLLKMAEDGKIKNIDYIPEDFPEITGELSEASVLVSLGKLKTDSCREDIVRSLFYMVTFNIAQHALGKSDFHNVSNVIFTGFYCRDNEFFLQCFAEAFNFFSKGTEGKRVYSMRHDGFLGALGALHHQKDKV